MPRKTAPWRLALGLLAGAAAGWLLFARPRGPAAAPGTSPTETPAIRFDDVTQAWGIAFRHDNGRTGQRRYPEIMGSGVALFDYDADGRLDIYFVNGNRLVGDPDPKATSTLYRNEGGGRFKDVTAAAGVAVAGYGQGACAGDADGDGHVDLLVTLFPGRRFFRNKGDGTFVESAQKAGLADDGWGQSCAFLDYDADGHLDLYVLNYLSGYTLDIPQTRETTLGGRKILDYLGPQPFSGAPSRLYRNRGDGTFEDVTKKAGVFRADGKGMGLAAVDFDGDGHTDIFQANDSMPDFLFRNRGDGTFEEIGLVAGVAVGGDGEPKASMGVDVGDLDNDGDLDIADPVVRQQVFPLYRNDGALFTDVTWEYGLAEATGRVTGFSTNFGDYDNDGDLDLYFANGEVHARENAAPDSDDTARYGTPDVVLANDGTGRLTDVSKTAGPYFQRALVGRGSAAGDLDDDGRVDLVVNNLGGPAVVLRNTSAGGHWVTLDLRQRGANWESIGAKVWLRAGGKMQYREVSGGGAYVSANDRRLHFGLGAAEKIDGLEIRWPDGATETRSDVPVDRVVRIDRAAAAR
jgi:hypothetical protein